MIVTFPPAASSGGTGGITGAEVPAYEINYTDVNTYADLPAANTEPNETHIVRTASGTWLLGTKKKAGLYYSNGVEWSYMGNNVSIDDTSTSNESVWSSAKTASEISGYSPIGHDHGGSYEPADSTILKEEDIGSTVQAHDPDTAKTDVAQTYTAAQRGSVSTVTYGANVTLNLASANNFQITMTGNLVLANPTNIVAGQMGKISLIQDGTGGRTVAWGTYFKFAGGVLPTYVTAGNSKSGYYYSVESATEIVISPIVDWK